MRETTGPVRNSSRGIVTLFRGALCQGECPPITVHDMRHTCATLLAALDVHPRVAMRVLRHDQVDVTMNVYTEVFEPTRTATPLEVLRSPQPPRLEDTLYRFWLGPGQLAVAARAGWPRPPDLNIRGTSH